MSTATTKSVDVPIFHSNFSNLTGQCREDWRPFLPPFVVRKFPIWDVAPFVIFCCPYVLDGCSRLTHGYLLGTNMSTRINFKFMHFAPVPVLVLVLQVQKYQCLDGLPVLGQKNVHVTSTNYPADWVLSL